MDPKNDLSMCLDSIFEFTLEDIRQSTNRETFINSRCLNIGYEDSLNLKDILVHAWDYARHEQEVPLLKKNDREKIVITTSPCFKWTGGKRREIGFFIRFMPSEPFDLYVEPFIGGGSFLFHLSPKKSLIGDMCQENIGFYNAYKQYGDEIRKEWDLVVDTYSKQNKEERANDYNNARKFLNTHSVPCLTDKRKTVEYAVKFLYRTQLAFRGMTRRNRKGEFNIPFGNYKTLARKQLTIDQQNVLKRAQIIHGDFKILFDQVDENAFIFLDPPYDSVFSNYGNAFTKLDHIRLFNCFKTTKAKCMLIIGQTPFIVGLYNNYIRARYYKNYAFKIYNKRIGKSIDNYHLVITNY